MIKKYHWIITFIFLLSSVSKINAQVTEATKVETRPTKSDSLSEAIVTLFEIPKALIGKLTPGMSTIVRIRTDKEPITIP